MPKIAKKIYVRFGFEDRVLEIDQPHEYLVQDKYYIIGYEDENGQECDELGVYLDQDIEYKEETMEIL